MRLSHDDQMRRSHLAFGTVQITPANVNQARALTPQTVALSARWARAHGGVKAFLKTSAAIRRLTDKTGR